MMRKITCLKEGYKQRKKTSEILTKKNVSMTLLNVKDTKKIDIVCVENILETHYEFGDDNPHSHSEAGKI